jgi:hypothetical protein
MKWEKGRRKRLCVCVSGRKMAEREERGVVEGGGVY